jgi:predicted MFS family arabinose efflux permease
MLTVWRRAAELPGWMKAVMLGQLVSAAGGLAWIYLTLYLVTDRGMTAQEAGFAAAAYGVGLLAGNLWGGWFGDRFGLREAVLGSLLGWFVTCSVMPFVPSTAIAAVAALAGATGGASRPNLSALVAISLPADRRREGIALSRTASNAGFTIGPPLGGLLAAYDFDAVFVLDAVSSLVLAAVVWRWVPRTARKPEQVGPERHGVLRALATDGRLLVLLASVVALDTVYRQIFSTMPLMLRDAGSTAVAYGVLIAISSAIIVLFEAPLAVRLRHHPAVSVVAGGFALVGLGLAAIAVWPALGGAVIAMVVITAGEMLYKPTATAHVADAAPEGMVGRYSSLYAAASISGTLFAPALGGTVYEHAPGLLWPAAAGIALLAAGAVWLTRRPPAAPAAPPSVSTAPRSSGSAPRP